MSKRAIEEEVEEVGGGGGEAAAATEDVVDAVVDDDEDEDDDDPVHRQKRSRNTGDASSAPPSDSGIMPIAREAVEEAAQNASQKIESIEAPSQREPPTKSRVLHVRNLPDDATEEDLAQLCTAHGQVTSAMRLKGKSQGFVEMASEDQAEAVIKGYGDSGALFRGKRVFFNYSNRDTITFGDSGLGDEQPPSHILLIVIQNQLYPVTVDTLYSIFGRFPKVQKISMFTKNAIPKALVQYETTEQATAAKDAFDGKDIYSGSCRMRIRFSALQDITINDNNQFRHDYTTSPAPAPQAGDDPSQPLPVSAAGAQNQGAAAAGAPAAGAHQHQHQHHQHQQHQQHQHQQAGGYDQQQQQYYQQYYQYYQGGQPAQGPPANQPSPYPPPHMPVAGSETQTPVIIIGNLIPDYLQVDHIYIICKFYGDVFKVKILPNKKENALVEYANTAQAQSAVCNLNGFSLGTGRGLKISLSRHKSLTVIEDGPFAKDYTRPSSLPNVTMLYRENPQLFSMLYTAPHANHNLLVNTYYPNTEGFYYDYNTGQYVPIPGYQFAGQAGGARPGGCVVIVGGLVPGVTTPDQLFTLFGLYGDVVRVKIMHQKQDKALVQYQTPDQARAAIQYLSGCPLHGSELRVNMSKHANVATPRPGAIEESRLTRDYNDNTMLHRFGNSAATHQLFAPSETLLISGLSANVTQEQIMHQFAAFGSVMGIRLHPESHTAHVQMGNLTEAITCLLTLDAQHFGGTMVRVSFSTSYQQ